MDIRDITTAVSQNTTSSHVKKSDAKVSGQASAASVTGDSYLESGSHNQVRSLVGEITEIPEIRQDVIDRARALLESGEIDSPERFEQAARGFHGDVSGY